MRAKVRPASICNRADAVKLTVNALSPAIHPASKSTTFRPSVVFGQDDRFLNLFADLVKFSPFIPLGSAGAQFQPVWVEDVARAIVMSLDNPETFGNAYPLVADLT